MGKSLLKLARAFVGVWSELRHIRILIEWLFTSNISATIVSRTEGRFTVTIDAVMLPPTAKELADAQKEADAFRELPSEEQLSGERAADILKRRAKGETIDPDEPGSDWEPW